MAQPSAGADIEGAVLLERLEPATSLSAIVIDGRDEEATDIIAQVIGSIKPANPPEFTLTAKDLARAFDWYRESGDEQILTHLLSAIWLVEEGSSVPPEGMPIILAHSMHAMLGN